MKNYHAGLFILVLCLSFFLSDAQAQHIIKITSENQNQFWDTGETIAKFNVLCHERPQNGVIRAGLERTNKKGVSVWRLLPRHVRTRVAAMQANGVPEQRIKKFRKRFSPKPHTTACRNNPKPGDDTPPPTPTPGFPSGDFVGNINSLKPYKNNISLVEARHIVRRAAFSDPALTQIGATQGLKALVNAMVDSPEIASIEQEAQDFAALAFTSGRWTSTAAYRYWDYLAIYGNPFRSRMHLFFHEHAPSDVRLYSNVSLTHTVIPEYINLIQNHSLGNFVELLKGYLWARGGAGLYLDNKDNHGGTGGGQANQNFARELLELFAVGTRGVGNRKHIPMFTENDVAAVTAYVSGFHTFSFLGTTTLGYAPALHNYAPYTVFQGQPWAANNVNFQPEQFIEYLAYNNENVARYLGEKLLAQFISPDTSEQAIQAMANLIIQHDFEIKPVMKKLLLSEAMFSQASRGVCLESAYESYVALTRKLQIPIRKQIGNLPVEFNATLWGSFNNSVINSGQRPLAPDTVFAWERNCGVNRNGSTAYGEQYISAQYIVAQQRATTDMVDAMQTQSYNWNILMPSLSATAPQTLAHFEDLFELKLTTSERNLLLQYMTHTRDAQGNLELLGWDVSNLAFLKSKISGLVSLFTMHPRSRLK